MGKSAPHAQDAIELAHALAQGSLTAEALAEALIERSVALEPRLKVWACFDATGARRRMRAHGQGRPLSGLPFAVKDNIDTEGVPTAYGSPIYAAHVPSADAACVALARAAGAWVLGKTACTEFANMTPCATRNPWHASHTPGGSSSGSAAAVAAGLVPLALGTQTAGSVIRPAAFCGIVGYKPSPRRVPRAGVKANADTLDEVGVMARSVADASWFAAVLAGQSSPVRAEPHQPRIAVTLTSREQAMSPAMAAAVQGAASRLSAAGASVAPAGRTAAFDALFDSLFVAQRTVQVYETARALAPEWQYRRAALSAGLRELIAEGSAIRAEVYAAALQTAATVAAGLDTLFGAADIVLTAAAIGAAPASRKTTGDPLFNRPWQLLGCPCLTLPGGRDADGLPLGLQLVARPGDDLRLFAAAAWVERALQSTEISRARCR